MVRWSGVLLAVFFSSDKSLSDWAQCWWCCSRRVRCPFVTPGNGDWGGEHYGIGFGARRSMHWAKSFVSRKRLKFLIDHLRPYVISYALSRCPDASRSGNLRGLE